MLAAGVTTQSPRSAQAIHEVAGRATTVDIDIAPPFRRFPVSGTQRGAEARRIALHQTSSDAQRQVARALTRVQGPAWSRRANGAAPPPQPRPYSRLIGDRHQRSISPGSRISQVRSSQSRQSTGHRCRGGPSRKEHSPLPGSGCLVSHPISGRGADVVFAGDRHPAVASRPPGVPLAG